MRKRTWGFRFSRLDAVALSAFVGLSLALIISRSGFTLVPAFVLGHFFLFCNVFRIRRSLEYTWSFVFLVNVVGWFLILPNYLWGWPLVVQLPVTLAVLIAEVRSPRYHGVFARRINASHLEKYLTGSIK